VTLRVPILGALLLLAGCGPGSDGSSAPASTVDLGVGPAPSTSSSASSSGSGASASTQASDHADLPHTVGGGAVRATRELLERLTPRPGGVQCTAPVQVEVDVHETGAPSLEEQVFGTSAGQVSVRELPGPCP